MKAGMTVTIIPCDTKGRCAYKADVGLVGRIIRVETDWTLVHFNPKAFSGRTLPEAHLARWFPTFHLREVV